MPVPVGTASGTMLGESSLSALIYHRTIFKKGAFVDETDRQAKGPTAGRPKGSRDARPVLLGLLEKYRLYPVLMAEFEKAKAEMTAKEKFQFLWNWQNLDRRFSEDDGLSGANAGEPHHKRRKTSKRYRPPRRDGAGEEPLNPEPCPPR